MSLYDFIHTYKSEILSRARAKVTSRQWPAISTHELESGLPLFLSPARGNAAPQVHV